MYYETKFQQEIFEIMASCDRLGLMYVVQKDVKSKKKWFLNETTEIVWKLQVVQYVKEEEENEDISGRPSESEEVDGEEERGNESH